MEKRNLVKILIPLATAAALMLPSNANGEEAVKTSPSIDSLVVKEKVITPKVEKGTPYFDLYNNEHREYALGELKLPGKKTGQLYLYSFRTTDYLRQPATYLGFGIRF